MKESRVSIGLRGRLAVSIALILLMALGITYLAVYRGTGDELRDRTRSDLESEVERLSGRLASNGVQGERQQRRKARTLVEADSFGQASRVISITLPGGATVTNQPDLLGLSRSDENEHGDEHSGKSRGDDDRTETADNLLRSPEGYSSVKVDDVGDVQVLSRAVETPGGRLATIRVGQPLAPVDRALQGLSDTFFIVGLATLLLAAAAGWLLASRTTRPMRRMADVAGGVDAGDLSSRMPIGATRDDEVRRLAEAFNHMLDRLEDAFLRQRSFVADASHDLRTPLTIIKGQLDVLARKASPGAEDVERVSRLVTTATDRMDHLIDDLLLLARAESTEGSRLETVELEPLLAADVESFREADGRQITLGPVTGTKVRINREDLSRVVSNLVANAMSHTGAEGSIVVSARDSGRQVEISVEDDGPGIPPEMRGRIFDRFARLDRSRSRDQGGSGLGLAIVKALVESQGGSVACDESTLGGARFLISLPAEANPIG